MKVLKFRQLFYSFIIMSLLTVAGCDSNNDGPKPYDGPTKRAVLLYAVASNNLYSNLRSDKAEIIKAANNMNLDGLSMLVYQVAPTGNPQLFELKRIKSDCPHKGIFEGIVFHRSQKDIRSDCRCQEYL